MNHAVSNNLCPVCGYDGLEDGTSSGEICSSCGTEFGYSDFQRSHEELRRRWISKEHAQWWSRYTPTPNGWSPVSQLRNIGYECTWADLQEIHLPETAWVSGMVVAASGEYYISVTRVYSPTVTHTHSQVVALLAPAIRMDGGRHSVNNRGLPNGLLVCQTS